MNLKKILAGMTALMCCTGALAFLPEFTETAKAKEVVSNDFEVSYGGWYGNEEYVTLTALEKAGIRCFQRYAGYRPSKSF